MVTSQQKHFNYRLSRARIVSENAFGRLKARWWRLLKQNDMAVKKVPKVIAACCVLHNICEIHKEVFDEEWLEGVPLVLDDNNSMTGLDGDTDCAENIRQTLMLHVNANPIPE